MMREINQWTQEELAEKLNISPSGYAKIEAEGRGWFALFADTEGNQLGLYGE